jgi:hypothetical protein
MSQKHENTCLKKVSLKTKQSVKDVMADYKWEVLPHPAYSPDKSPPDYDLLPKLKNPL